MFDFTIDGVKATARLKIISSGLSGNRAGWQITLRDGSGRGIALYVGESEVFLLGTNTDMAGPLSMDTTDKVHVYELLVQGSGASLRIDGSDTGLSLTLSQFSVAADNNAMNIGDLALVHASSSELKGFSLCVNCATLPVENVTWGNIKALFAGE